MKRYIKILLVLILLIILNGCSEKPRKVLNIKEDNISELKAIGYSKEELEIIKTLDSDNIDLLTEYDYIKNINDLIESKYFNSNKLLDYLKSYNTTNNIIHSMILVNNDYKEYNNKVISILNDKYFIYDYFNRYIKFMENHDQDIVKNVNVNRDYEYYTNYKTTDLNDNYLILVNKYYKLPDGYKNNNMININGYLLDKNVYEQFKIMRSAAEKENLHFELYSTYRSYQKQESIYNNYLNSYGLEWTNKFCAKPGFSEHQTGYAFDVRKTSEKSFDKFENTKEYQWLKDNSYKYGFIIRYPDGEENITGYNFEAWHYRYVGIEVATKIYEEKITFDEYYAYYIENSK